MNFFSIFSITSIGIGMLFLLIFAMPFSTKAFSKICQIVIKFYWFFFAFFSALSVLFYIQSISTIFHEIRRSKDPNLDDSTKILIQSNQLLSQRNIFITSIGFLLNIFVFILIFDIRSLSKQNKEIQTEIVYEKELSLQRVA